MNKKTFVQNAVIELLNNPAVLEKPKTERFDFAISLAELAWSKLSERGYGATTEKAPDDDNKKDWYAEIINKAAFDKAWKMYRKTGARNAAAKAWLSVPSTEHDRIYYAIPRYFEQCHQSGTAIAHFAKWLNQRRYESFDKPTERAAANDPANDTAGKIRHLEMLIKWAKTDEQKTALNAELRKIKATANN